MAFFSQSIGASFTWILNLTAGIGPVYLLRWFWWRINPWSEIAAMCASLPVLLLRPHALVWLGWPPGLLIELWFMVGATAAIWLPITLMTAPVDRGTLKRFYASVHPPGWWKPVALAQARSHTTEWITSLFQWAVATIALMATTIGPLQLLVGSARWGWIWCGVAAICWGVLAVNLSTVRSSES